MSPTEAERRRKPYRKGLSCGAPARRRETPRRAPNTTVKTADVAALRMLRGSSTAVALGVVVDRDLASKVEQNAMAPSATTAAVTKIGLLAI